MRPEERDLAYLWDMLDAARTAIEFTHGVKFQKYAEDRKLQLCPRCNVVVQRVATGGAFVGEPWGCTKYPACRGRRRIEATSA